MRLSLDVPDRTQPRETAAHSLQDRHVAYQGVLRARGKIAAGGPFSDQPDESWRGMTFYLTPLEEARQLVAADPSVVAGRLAADVIVWWTPPNPPQSLTPRARPARGE